MRYFEITHMCAGRWMQGDTVSEQEIKAGGFDLDDWIKTKAVKQVDDPDDATPAPEPEQAKPVSLSDVLNATSEKQH